MKTFFVLIIVLGIIGGSWFYISNELAGRKINQPKLTVAAPTKLVEAKKSCSCCSERLEQIRKRVLQKRKSRELWARGMLTLYSTDEGIKRIAVKDSRLAERIQQRLEKEKGNLGKETQNENPPSF